LKTYISVIFIVFLGCGNNDKALSTYQEGLKFFQEKKLDQAEKYFSDAVKLDDKFLNAWLMLAKIHYHSKDYDKALSELKAILDKDPGHTGALYWKGRVLVISGKDENGESLKILQSVLDIDSHHLPARLLLALLYEKNGKYKEALHEYITVMSEEESLISARGNLAVLYRRLGLKERASQEINRAVKIAEITGSDARSLNLIKGEIEKWEGK